MFKKYTLLFVGFFLLAGPAKADPVFEPVPAIHQLLDEARLTCLMPALELDSDRLAVLREFYRFWEYQPVWSAARLDALATELAQLADDGLDPQHYFLHALQQLRQIDGASPRLRACLDVLASQAYLQALRDLRVGRLERAKVEPIWYAEGSAPVFDLMALLAEAQAGLDALSVAFARARPAFEPYQALRRLYALRRRQPPPTWLPIPSGPLLKPEAVDARVPLLEQRLASEGYLPPAVLKPDVRGDHLYSIELVTAVKAFQRRHQLKEDGIVGPQTLAALNRTAAEQMEQIRVNLERLRWLSRELPATGVVVNVAGAEIFFYRDGKPVWQARTQVGRPSRETPLLKSSITHLTLNPTWTVPPTILREDKLPEIRHDLGYLTENRMRVFDYDGNELDPDSIDWSAPSGILLRQDAGPHNALGRVAIRFPNPFAVYLHDTPSQRLFERLPRTFSSGCVRVEQITQLVDLLLADAEPEERQRIDRLWRSGRTRRANLPQPLPVLLTYWTADVGADGELLLRPDLYGHDPRIAAALDTSHSLWP